MYLLYSFIFKYKFYDSRENIHLFFKNIISLTRNF